MARQGRDFFLSRRALAGSVTRQPNETSHIRHARPLVTGQRRASREQLKAPAPAGSVTRQLNETSHTRTRPLVTDQRRAIVAKESAPARSLAYLL